MAASASSGTLFEALAAADYDGLVQLYGQTAVHALLAHPPVRSRSRVHPEVRMRCALSGRFRPNLGGNRERVDAERDCWCCCCMSSVGANSRTKPKKEQHPDFSRLDPLLLLLLLLTLLRHLTDTVRLLDWVELDLMARMHHLLSSFDGWLVPTVLPSHFCSYYDLYTSC